jgi:hypothetical protein
MAAQLQEALDNSLAENERLAQQINDYEKRAEKAERRAHEVQEKLKILESLKTKEYQTVVTELFEGPSRRAVRLTLIVAVASIAIGLTQTILSSIYAERANKKNISELSSYLRPESQNNFNRDNNQTKGADLRTSERVSHLEPKIERDGTTESRAFILLSGTKVDVLVGSGQDKYYQIEVPSNSPRLQVDLLQRFRPGHAHIYVRHQSILPKAAAFENLLRSSAECSNRHHPSPDVCTFDNPRPGLWIIEVQGFKSSQQDSKQPELISHFRTFRKSSMTYKRRPLTVAADTAPDRGCGGNGITWKR